MLSRVTLVLACLYLVQAGFIKLPQGAENTGNENDVATNAINDNGNEEVTNARNSDFEDFNNQELLEDTSNAAVALASARACTNSACNQFCRRRGYIWGHCVGVNICRCYRFVRALNENTAEFDNEERIANDGEKVVKNESEDFNIQDVQQDSSEAAQALASARVCTNSACNQFCRRRGYIWGHCVGVNVCRCYRFVRDLNGPNVNEINVNKDLVSEDIVRDDDISEDFNSKDIREDNSEASGVQFSARMCSNVACSQFCVSRGYIFGTCFGVNICRCYRARILNEEIEANQVAFDDIVKDDVSEDFNTQELLKYESEAAVGLSSARACTNSVCYRFCQSQGYSWGHCVTVNICRCYRWVRAFEGKVGKAENKIEVNLEQSEDIVKDADVSKDFNTQELNDNSAAVALSSARACTNSVCNRFCVQRGYHWGYCVSTNICRCVRRIRAFDEKAGEAENKIDLNLEQSEDIVKDADASKDFNTQELNDNSEAAVALSSARACTNSVCNRFCVQRGYRWGHCVGTNICRCYR